jgi:Carboxypeptidase regulatory-like domain
MSSTEAPLADGRAGPLMRPAVPAARLPFPLRVRLPRRRPWIALILGFLVALALGVPRGAAAQEPAGSVEGTVRAEEGAPLAFALVRLLLVDSRASGVADVITDAEGRYRFPAVPAGEYRLQVEQIGYERIVSPVVRVRAGETLRHDIRGTPAPIRLEGITATAGRCLTVGQLAEDPELATLWNEAKKGVETRRAFEMQYRFSRTLVQDIETHWVGRRGPTQTHTERPMFSAPDSVPVRDARRRALFRAHGYSDGESLSVPEDKELLEDEFLRAHCLEAAFEEAGDAYVIRFRGIQPPREGAALRGTIRLDAKTYLVQRLEFEYLARGRPFARTVIEYEDIPVGSGTLRLPTGGRASIQFRGRARRVATEAASTFSYTYIISLPRREQPAAPVPG